MQDDLLLSGSRDCSICLWSLSQAKREFCYDYSEQGQSVQPTPVPSRVLPIISRKEHSRKVRDLKTNGVRGEFYTLGADGCVKIWDSTNFDVVSSVSLYDTNELVCLAWDQQYNILAVGSQNYVTIVDPRSSQIIQQIVSKDEEWGVRSLSFQVSITSQRFLNHG
jgi:WD repeat-containing protein 40A